MAKNSARPKGSKKPHSVKTESFLGGLFSLMAQQCIFSAMIFGVLYYIKNSGFAFSEPICAFVKNAVTSPLTIETIKEIATQAGLI